MTDPIPSRAEISQQAERVRESQRHVDDILADVFRRIASVAQRAAASTRDDYSLAPPAGQPDTLVTVTGYAVSVLPADHPEFPDYALFVELNPHRAWVVHDGGAGFDTDGRPRVGEPYRHPFPSLDDALALARRLAPGMTIGSRTATDVLLDTVDALMPLQGAAVRPLETPAGADAGVESTEGAEGAQVSAGTAQVDRQARREQLVVLLSRMQRDVLLDTERGLLRTAVETEIADAEQVHTQLERLQRSHESAAHVCTVLHADNVQLRDERDRARRVAVELEQELAHAADQLADAKEQARIATVAAFNLQQRTPDAAQRTLGRVHRATSWGAVWAELGQYYGLKAEEAGAEARARRTAVEARAEEAVAQRDALAQQVAAVAALHVHNADADYCEVCADHGEIQWPCATIRALNPQEDQ